jgi:hypothetical protein
MRHGISSELADHIVSVTTQQPLYGQRETTVDYRVEDWWDRVSGGSWMDAVGNPACLGYAIRASVAGLPTDDEVLYGHTPDGLGHLVHISEIAATASEAGAA